MLIYSKTYDNIKTKNCNFPVEDSFWCDEKSAIVADGITRDPITTSFEITQEEFIKLYPRPSGAEIAAKTICKEFSKLISLNNNLKDILNRINQKVKTLNDENIPNCDYLINDYYGAVASCINIVDNILSYSYLCDSGLIVYNKKGKKKFQTNDDYKDVEKYFESTGIPWSEAKARVMVRKDHRNNPKEKYSYGALTGEENANHYIKDGKVNLDKDDYIIVYSDGFVNFFERDDFFHQIINFNREKFDIYIENLAESDYYKYGKEKTLVIFKKE